MKGGPLAGLKVIEMANSGVPFGCMLLADLGADVLRVNRPGSGTPAGPLDRGRRTVTVDLKQPAGASVVLRLAREADVFVEGFRPGVAERLGIGPDVLFQENPRLVYGRLTGWGQTGPLADRSGHDINFVALAGALEPFGRHGEAPHPALNVLGDFAGGGAFLALGILAALYERQNSGIGQVVDAAMVDGASVLMAFVHGLRAAGMWGAGRGENLLDGGAHFYDTYETADGAYVAVGAIEPQFYAELLAKLAIDPVTMSPQMDPTGWAAGRQRFAEIFRRRTRQEWTDHFFGSDACVSPVLSPWEAYVHPHNAARESFLPVDGVLQPAPAPRFGRTPLAPPRAIDGSGRNVQETLRAWGLRDHEVQAITADGAVA